MREIDGVPVTDEHIQAWADEAERGYDVNALRKRGRKPMGDAAAAAITVRLDDSVLAAVDRVAREQHLDRSKVIRAAIQAYVA